MAGTIFIALVFPAILTVDSATEPLVWGLVLLGVGLSVAGEDMGLSNVAQPRTGSDRSDLLSEVSSRSRRSRRCALE